MIIRIVIDVMVVIIRVIITTIKLFRKNAYAFQVITRISMDLMKMIITIAILQSSS